MPRQRNITQETRTYIWNHPSVRDCLARGLINHSALARQICDELAIKSFDAVLAAAKRVTAPNPQPLEKQIKRLINEAQVSVTNKIAVVVISPPQDFERVLLLQKNIRRARGRFNMIDGGEVVTIVLSEQHLGTVRASLKNFIRAVVTGLAQIHIIFDERIETTPGVVAHFYGLLAHHGVNVREEMSCWTDLILIVDERDVAKALEVCGQRR
ncbi:MAG: hypothetical protein J0M12_06420 [Deltaproteobacteria bacterium]|nr:hypothetical protein [Deltaproteobacteria bacterium]